jgi:rhodanese-related sulfurtransferase
MSYNIADVKKEIETGTAQLYDVREQDEWDDGHLNKASLVPLSILRDYELPEGIDFDKAVKTYIHCRSGARVQLAAPILEEMGFENVIPLDEGFTDLTLEGFEEA